MQILYREPFECNRNIFLQKSCTKCYRVTSSRPISKKSKLEISLNQQSEIFIKFVFIVCPSRKLPKYIETKVLTTRFYLIKKKRSGTRFPASFSV